MSPTTSEGDDLAKADATLDLRTKPAKGEGVDVTSVPPYSARWAEVVRPLTRTIFALLAAVLLVPFLFVFIGDGTTRTAAFDWAKTILAPIVGFASAAIGYYYGTRSAASQAGSEKKTED